MSKPDSTEYLPPNERPEWAAVTGWLEQATFSDELPTYDDHMHWLYVQRSVNIRARGDYLIPDLNVTQRIDLYPDRTTNEAITISLPPDDSHYTAQGWRAHYDSNGMLRSIDKHPWQLRENSGRIPSKVAELISADVQQQISVDLAIESQDLGDNERSSGLGRLLTKILALEEPKMADGDMRSRSLAYYEAGAIIRLYMRTLGEVSPELSEL